MTLSGLPVHDHGAPRAPRVRAHHLGDARETDSERAR